MHMCMYVWTGLCMCAVAFICAPNSSSRVMCVYIHMCIDVHIYAYVYVCVDGSMYVCCD